MKDDNLLCENCEELTHCDNIIHDRDSAPLCKDCFNELIHCPDFYEDGKVPEEVSATH